MYEHGSRAWMRRPRRAALAGAVRGEDLGALQRRAPESEQKRAVPRRGASAWWGVSRGLSGDFMYITIPQAGTRAVHRWLTGRRSR